MSNITVLRLVTDFLSIDFVLDSTDFIKQLPISYFSGSLLVLAISLASAQVRPPNFSPDAIPETSFTCEDKITGGYYADQEADCQLFHVCVQVSEYEVSEDFYRIDILRIFEI